MAETIETMSPLAESHGNVAEMLGHCLSMASIEKAMKKLSEFVGDDALETLAIS